jgi:hypothetical protein
MLKRLLKLICGGVKSYLCINKKEMETTQSIKITPNNAKLLYKTMPGLRPALEDTFGKDFFSNKITDRIKTYEDACAELGIKPIDEAKMKQVGFTDDEITYRKIKTITQALNEGWKCDWNDSDQHKWYPWFKMSSGGFVFDGTYYAYSDAYAGDASRLCFKSEELAIYAGKQFLQLYSDFIK